MNTKYFALRLQKFSPELNFASYTIHKDTSMLRGKCVIICMFQIHFPTYKFPLQLKMEGSFSPISQYVASITS